MKSIHMHRKHAIPGGRGLEERLLGKNQWAFKGTDGRYGSCKVFVGHSP